MDVNLVYFKPDGDRKDIPLHGSEILIGRAEDCNLRIPLAAVSRQHCRIIIGDADIVVEDLGSANGTYVNNQRISRQSVGAGDRLGVGQAAFVVQVDGKPKKVVAPSAAPEPAVEVESGELISPVATESGEGSVVEVAEVVEEIGLESGSGDHEVVLEEESVSDGDVEEIAVDIESADSGNEGAGSSSVEDILLELEAAEEQESKKRS